ncbi:MAG: MGMT family protein [Deltaproteobacteria bacterium]|nr:MGMT family protein [Deltaproteobacteria bacterium]
MYRHIYRVVKQIPAGSVATYGQVAELAGMPGGARVVGTALRALKETGSAGQVPWQRVVGKKSPGRGKISILDPVGGAMQKKLLESEGVELEASGAISLDRFGWLPPDAGRR